MARSCSAVDPFSMSQHGAWALFLGLVPTLLTIFWVDLRRSLAAHFGVGLVILLRLDMPISAWYAKVVPQKG